MIPPSDAQRHGGCFVAACLCLALAGALALTAPRVALAATPRSAAPPAPVLQSADPPTLLALQQAELAADDGASGDAFGSAVAISGDTALVGAPNKDGGAGAAYLFVRSGMTWSQQAELVDPGTGAHDHFGCSVALSGDLALVGAYGTKAGTHPSAGAAYLFVCSGTGWSQAAELTASDAADDDEFGSAVALTPATALIGARNKSFGDAYYTGAAYFFSDAAGSWSQQAEVADPNPNYTDDFGAAVALSGNQALIGAPGTSVDGQYWRGAAYIYGQGGDGWTEQAELSATDGVAGDDFGTTVALDGDTALIGAVAALNWTGTAYVFAGSGSSWSQQVELSDPDAVTGDNYGDAVALDAGSALVGACLKTAGSQGADGCGFVFTPVDGQWSQRVQISAPDAAANDNLGVAVAISGDTALLGAPNHGGAGAVYVEELSVGYLLTYRAGPGGSISGTAPQVVAPGGNGSQVTAVPESGYHFIGWSDGVETAVRTDSAVQGNLTVTADFAANPTTPPTTTVSGLRSGWVRHAVTLHFMATPAAGGGAIAYTEHRLDGGAWTRGTSVTIAGQGTTTVWYRSADIYGNLETVRSCTVRIDTAAPTVKDKGTMVLSRGRTASFAYRLADNLARRLTCRLIVTQFGKAKLVVKGGSQPVGQWLTLRTPVSLPSGCYSWRIVAADQAGNVSWGAPRRLLVVAAELTPAGR